MTPEQMRNQRWAIAVGMAEDAGWTSVEVVVEGFMFVATVSAVNASEQIVEGKLSEIESLFTDLGEPEDYPAVEEYDVPEEMPSTLDLSDEGLEAMEAYVAAGEEDAAAGEAEGAGAEAPEESSDPTNGLHEDVHDRMDERGPSPKELYQGTQNDLQDRGGIPNQVKEATMTVQFNGEQYVAPEGHHIEARKAGKKARTFGKAINGDTKKQLVIDHWFFYAVKNGTKETLLAGGTITVQNGRFVAAPGRRIVARKGDMYFEALSLSTSFKEAGWVLSVTQ